MTHALIVQCQKATIILFSHQHNYEKLNSSKQNIIYSKYILYFNIKNLFSIYVSHHSISPKPTTHSPSLQSVTLSTPRYYSIYSRQCFDLTLCFKNHIFNYLQNCKINETPSVDVKSEETSTSASASKTSTAEVKQSGRKHPRE